MKIAFAEISRGKNRYALVDDGWFPHQEVTATSPATAELVLQRQSDDMIRLQGRLNAAIQLACGRCGEMVDFTIDEEFSYLVTTREEKYDPLQAVECSDEECSLLYLLEPVIDLGEILREQVILAIPIRVLCNEDCRGLCPKCGLLLRDGGCGCDTTNEDSPFALLRALKKQDR